MKKDKRMMIKWDFLGGSVVKTPNAGDLGSIPSQKTGFNPGQGARSQTPQPTACMLDASNTWNSQIDKEIVLNNYDRK